MSNQYVTHWQTDLNKVRTSQGKPPIVVDADFGSQTYQASKDLLPAGSVHLSSIHPNSTPSQKLTPSEKLMNEIGLGLANRNLENRLPWVNEALKYKGMREIKGIRHNKIIVNMIIDLGGWWRDDETPWCGVFVAHCLKESNRAVPKHWYRAKAYADYGTRLNDPCYGCIGVMGRKGGWHVCFVIGKTKNGDMVVIGGNQNNRVSVAVYPRKRFIAFVFPPKKDGTPSLPYPYRYELPLFDSRNLTKPISES